MANKKVSQLTSKPSVLTTDLFPIADPSTGQLFKTTISDLGTAIGSGVSSVNGLVGAVVLDTDDIQELVSPTNKWFTDTRARAALSASSPLTYNSGTGAFGIQVANGSQNGYLSSADWTTFNAKQAALSGTGFVKSTGGTISYDTNTYLTTSAAASTYLALAGGTLTGNLNGTNITISNSLIAKGGTFNGGPASGGVVTIDGLGSDLLMNRADTSNGASITLLTNAVEKWNIGLRSSGTTDNFFIYNSTLLANAVTINNSNSSVVLAGALGIGLSPLAGSNLNVGKNITGAITSYGILADGETSSDVTTAINFASVSKTIPSSFTLGTYNHFYAIQATFGAGSSVTTQQGFVATSTLIGATTNIGFRGDIPSGTNRWNLYMGGTANNYLSGNLTIGTTSDLGYKLNIAGSTNISTTNFYRYNGDTGIIGSGSAVSGGNASQLGIRAASDILFATNGANERMRISSDGNVGIGTTSPNYKLHVVTTAVAGRQDMTNIDRTAANMIRFTNPQYSALASMGILLRVFPDSDARQGAGIIASGGSLNGETDLDLFVSKDLTTSNSYSALSIKGGTGNVGIGTTTPVPTAILHADSTTKGVLFPRMTTTQKNAISSPATGLVIFDTTLGKLCVFSGTWQTVTSV